ADAGRRQAGVDGRLLVADRVPRRLDHADGAVGQPDGRLVPGQVRPSAAAALMAPLLELDRLSTHYVSAAGARVVRAVDEVSLSLNAGETLGIVGESGSGKSTLALTLMRVLPPAARIVGGRILLEGEDLVQKPEEEMREIRGK